MRPACERRVALRRGARIVGCDASRKEVECPRSSNGHIQARRSARSGRRGSVSRNRSPRCGRVSGVPPSIAPRACATARSSTGCAVCRGREHGAHAPSPMKAAPQPRWGTAQAAPSGRGAYAGAGMSSPTLAAKPGSSGEDSDCAAVTSAWMPKPLCSRLAPVDQQGAAGGVGQPQLAQTVPFVQVALGPDVVDPGGGRAHLHRQVRHPRSARRAKIDPAREPQHVRREHSGLVDADVKRQAHGAAIRRRLGPGEQTRRRSARRRAGAERSVRSRPRLRR